MSDEREIREELQTLEAYLARLQDHRQRVEGRRDELLRRLCDTTGAASSRFVAAR